MNEQLRSILSQLFICRIPSSASWVYRVLVTTTLLFHFSLVYAQHGGLITGIVRDAKTGELLPGVSVTIDGTSYGTSTDLSGRFHLTADTSNHRLKISYIGYKTIFKNAQAMKSVDVKIDLSPNARQLSGVSITSGKKTRYRNKDNPAVELIRQVIAHKKQNRLENFSYAEYQQYAKLTFYLSNLSDQFMNKKLFRNYHFLFREQDSTEIGGKNLLPVYMEEKLSDNYFRRGPYAKKELVKGSKQVKYDENFFDNDGLKAIFNRMYQDIDIYDNNISLLANNMLSPIADSGPTYYKYFITDTIKETTPNLIELAFTPRSKEDLAFEGTIYITTDGRFAVAKAVLGINKEINVNFLRKMRAELTFDKDTTSRYHLAKTDLKMEFGINKSKGDGLFGERTVIINNFNTGVTRPDQTYSGPSVQLAPGAGAHADDYWQTNRPDTLKQMEKGIYKDVDSLQTIPSFRRTVKLATLLLAGYYDLGPFEIGPTNTFYNFNPVEGFRLRFGGRTTPALSKRYYFETYGANGFKDHKFKYFLRLNLPDKNPTIEIAV